MNRRWQDEPKEKDMGWGASKDKKKVKHGPLHGGGNDYNKSKRKGVQDRDDNHRDEGGEIWEGTRKFGPFRAKK